MTFLIYSLLILTLLVVLTLLWGLLYRLRGCRLEARKFRTPGRLVDVGGRRLHLTCRGEGSPVVVFDAALGASSLSWLRVQEGVSTFTRTCAYDRAGFGWSDPPCSPRRLEEILSDLRLLLKGAAVAPPYVLVGHSYGAFTAQLFAARHPSEVAGLVLVDPPENRRWVEMDAPTRKRWETGVRLCRRGAFLARIGIARLLADLAGAGVERLVRLGVRAVGPALNSFEQDRLLTPVRHLPPEARKMLKVAWSRPEFYETLESQILHVPEAAELVESLDLPDVPLIVLSATRQDPGQAEFHRGLAGRSRQGERRVARDSGHWIPLEEPELVVRAIGDVVERARRDPS